MTCVRPGVLGRSVRVLCGSAFLALGGVTLAAPGVWITQAVPQSLFMWGGAALCFYVLRGVPDKGFQRHWGRRPQLVVLLLACGAILVNVVRTGSWWGPPLGALVFVLILYVSAHLGLSLVLAGLLAHPG